MAASLRIDLGGFVNADGTVLAGRDKGEKAREELHLSDRDQTAEPVEVFIPPRLSTVTMSFFLGLLADSVRKLRPQRFREMYRFTGRDDADQMREELIAKALRNASPLQATQPPKK